jgi:hypothetical protein
MTASPTHPRRYFKINNQAITPLALPGVVAVDTDVVADGTGRVIYLIKMRPTIKQMAREA